MKIQHLIFSSILFFAMQSSAHATVYQVDFTMYGISGFNVNDHDAFPSGDPDLYFAMGISTNGSATEMNLEIFFRSTPVTALNWNPGPITVSAVIEDVNLNNTWFYFVLLDADSDADDNLGSHWFQNNSNGSTSYIDNVLNNNAALFDPSFLLSDVEGSGDFQNYHFNHGLSIQPVPLPAAIYLFFTAIISLAIGSRKRFFKINL
jgi:hypothetical protein